MNEQINDCNEKIFIPDVCVFVFCVAGVGERPSLSRLPAAGGHLLGPVRPGATAAARWWRAPSISAQLGRFTSRPASPQSGRWLLRGRQAPDSRLRPVAVMHC